LEQLIDILHDRAASIAERDDAAMDLAAFDDALDVLIAAASDPEDNPIVLASCGTSIAEIWNRLGIFDETVRAALAPEARGEIDAAFGGRSTR